MEKLSSRRNPLCQHIRNLGTDRSYRNKHGEFLCDGKKLLEEALKNDTTVTNVLTASLPELPLPLETRVYLCERSLINALSPLKNSQDTLFTCAMQASDADDYAPGTHVLLDAVSDPGNVGAIIRTANAFGVNSVMLFGECADVYNPKTIRGTMGAIFRQKTVSMSLPSLEALKNKGFVIIGSAPESGGTIVTKASFDNAIIAIGNEGRGLSEQIEKLCDDMVRIPIAPECESLNAAVAAAILIWEASKARRR